MTIRAVIFDFGDVLMRNPDRSGRRLWERRLGLDPGEMDRLVFQSEVMRLAMVGRAGIDDVWRVVGERLSIDVADTQQLSADFWNGAQLDERLVGFVRDLRPRFRTAILSDAWLGCRQLFSETLKLGDVFDEIIISAEEGVAKPNRAIFEIALKRLAVEPAEAVFVDDLAANVTAARTLGMFAIQFTDTERVLAAVRGIIASNG